MFLLSSINARGIGPRKRDFVKNDIHKSSVYICCVQETLLFEPPLLPGGLGLVSGPPLWGSRVVYPF